MANHYIPTLTQKIVSTKLTAVDTFDPRNYDAIYVSNLAYANYVKENSEINILTNAEIQEVIMCQQPKCSMCSLPYSQCEGHRVAIQLRFLVENQLLIEALAKTLNGICISVNSRGEYRGCGKSRSQGGGCTCSRRLKRSSFHVSKEFVSAYKIRVLAATADDQESGAFSHRIISLKYIRAFLTKHEIMMIGSTDLPAKVAIMDKLNVAPFMLRKTMYVANQANINWQTLEYSEFLKFAAVPRDIDVVTVKGFMEFSGTLESIWYEQLIADRAISTSGTVGRQLTSTSGIPDEFRILARILCGKASKNALMEDKTPMAELPSKTGTLRHSLMGRTVMSVGRTVVTSGSCPFGNVQISYCFADSLVPEVVTPDNFEFMSSLGSEGWIYMVYKKSIKKYEKFKSSTRIEPGDYIFRGICNGDVLIANRQPTNHVPSLTAHHVELWDKPTIGLPSPNTVPYNADFDGDEMNLHIPVTVHSIVELITSQHALNGIINASTPIFCPVFHEASVFFYMTTTLGFKLPIGPTGQSIRRQLFAAYIADPFLMQRIANYEHRRFIAYTNNKIKVDLEDKDVIENPRSYEASEITLDNSEMLDRIFRTRRDVLSLMFPPYFCFTRGKILIDIGIFIKGTVDKKAIGQGNGSILHAMYHLHGSKKAARFVAEVCTVAKVVEHMVGLSMSYKSFSVGSVADQKRVSVAVEETCKKYTEYQQLINRANTTIAKEALEKTLRSVTNKPFVVVRNSVINVDFVPKEDGPDPIDSINIAVHAKTRGSDKTFIQMAASLGQQYLGGNIRVDIRALSCFTEKHRKMDLALPEQHGYIKSSYARGLSPTETVCEACPVRDSVVTAKTEIATMGHLTNSLTVAMSTIASSPDMTRRIGNLCSNWSHDGFVRQNFMYPLNPSKHRGHRRFGFNVAAIIDELNNEFLLESQITSIKSD
jgi:DNA-directed RNA polymerase beta' subunit